MKTFALTLCISVTGVATVATVAASAGTARAQTAAPGRSLEGSGDGWVDAKVLGLELKVPSDWQETVRQDTHRFEPPSGDAGMELSVYPVTPREPELCLSQLLKALNEPGWERARAGGSPAARKRSRDASPDKKEAYETITYLGCNGRTKWVLTLSSKLQREMGVQPLAERVIKSVRYATP